MLKCLALTPGEPAGIGPDVTVMLAQKALPSNIVVVADKFLLQQRAEQLDLPLNIIPYQKSDQTQTHAAGSLRVLHVPLLEKCEAGKLNSKNVPYVLKTLDLAIEACLSNEFAGLITGLVHNEVINDSGSAFTGHTDYLASACGCNDVVMLFTTDLLRLALVTTHIPLSEVPSAITPYRLEKTLLILKAHLQQYFGIEKPEIYLAGLNPHAGEGGYLGTEESEVIIPLVKKLQQEGMALHGPYSADILFTPNYLEKADVIVAMYHDQALPVVKCLGFGQAVNVTLGLPFVRTSVDHGTALDLAGSRGSDPGSLLAAVNTALQMTACL